MEKPKMVKGRNLAQVVEDIPERDIMQMSPLKT